jgi:nitrite reductase/ring-hydroxylating ferredoxin subunit
MTTMTESWQIACRADEIEEGSALSVTVAGRRICIVRHEGAFFSLDDVCSHGHAFLSEGYCDTTDCVLECPLHGGLVDFRTGKAVSAPIEKDSQIYATRVEGGEVLIEITP